MTEPATEADSDVRATLSVHVEEIAHDDRRREATVTHVAALGVTAVSVGLLLSALVDLGAAAGDAEALAIPGAIGLIGGVAVVRWTRPAERVSSRDALVAVAVTWAAVCVLAAVPFVLAGVFEHPDDALFEAVSGVSGTGSTVLPDIEAVGRGVLFWRQLTQWYGGMGMVVLAVAVLPFAGVGGMELLSSESPGPESDRLTPRVSDTARRLWLLYGGFTVVTIAGLAAAGMGVYDSVTHAFTTVSTGGFSPYNASIAHFDSLLIEVVLIVFMLFGATSFTLHWASLGRRRWWRPYVGDADFRFFVALFVLVVVTVTVVLTVDGRAAAEAFRVSAFTVASVISSTGFAVEDFTFWVPGAQLVLLFVMMSGGMAGSTAGGMKTMRVHVMTRHVVREARRARSPRAVLPVWMGRTVLPESIFGRVAGFVLLYVLVGVVATVVVSALGAHTELAFGGVATSMGNGGPGLAEAGGSFLPFTRPARGVLMGLMLVGRLEILPVIVAVAALVDRRPRRVRPGRV